MSMGSTRDILLMDKKKENFKPDFKSPETDAEEQNKEEKQDEGAGANEDTPNTKKQKENLNAVEENYYNLSEPIMLTNFFVNRPLLCLTIITLSLGVITGLCIIMDWFVDSQSTNRDYLIWDNEKTINYDKSALATSMLISGINDSDAELPL